VTTLKKVRGLRALVEDVVEHGSRAVERVHLATARRTFTILEQIPVIAEPARAVHLVYDATVGASYAGVRLVNRAVGAIAELAIDAIEEAPRAHAEPAAGEPAGEAPGEPAGEAPGEPAGEAPGEPEAPG
jgi:hypothetical protein